MFIKQYAGLRGQLLAQYDLRALGDFAVGAFDEVPNDVLSVVVSAFRRVPPLEVGSIAQQPTPPDDRSYDRARTWRKRAAVLCQQGCYGFHPAALKVVPEWPLVYWWDEATFSLFGVGTLGEETPARFGTSTGNNTRFIRLVSECRPECNWDSIDQDRIWSPWINGAKGRAWMEPHLEVVWWKSGGLEIAIMVGSAVRNVSYIYRLGVAFSMIGNEFAIRLHRYPSVFGNKGSSVYSSDVKSTVCAMNSTIAKNVLQSINPGIGFEVGDVNRLPVFQIEGPQSIVDVLGDAFTNHESHRESSVEFQRPGPSPWRHAQDWAQLAVDRPEGEPLPTYIEELDLEPPTDHLSFALGVALGRFGANGKGILDPDKDDLSSTLPDGICFLDGTLDKAPAGDSLGHSTAELLHRKWSEYAPSIDPKTDLRTWLRLKFFTDIHKGMYENRPIYFPLSSAKKTFVAYVSIHRWTENTLRALLAEHLHPALTRIEGEIWIKLPV